MSEGSEFLAATAVAALGGGRWRAEVDPAWGAPTGPNGGYLAAIAARALEAEANADGARRLRSLTTHYVRPASGGELEIEVESVREGRRVSVARFSGSQAGRAVLTGLAAFVAPGLDGAGEWVEEMPDVAPPPAADAPAVGAADYRPDGSGWLGPVEGAPPIVRKILGAPVIGAWPFSGEHETANGAWLDLPQPAPLDAARIALLCDVWVPPAFTPLRAPAIAPTIDLTIHVRADLGPTGLESQPVLGHYSAPTASDGVMVEDGRLFSAGGALLAQSRQLALLAPVASR